MAVHLAWKETFPLRIPEWICAGMMTLWGWTVLTVGGLFSSNPSFAGMAAIMPQWTWGLWATSLGLAGLLALAINGFWKPTPFIRIVSAFGRTFLWIQIEFGLLATGEPTTGTTIYVGLAALEIWNIYRAAGDARRAVS